MQKAVIAGVLAVLALVVLFTLTRSGPHPEPESDSTSLNSPRNDPGQSLPARSANDRKDGRNSAPHGNDGGDSQGLAARPNIDTVTGRASTSGSDLRQRLAEARKASGTQRDGGAHPAAGGGDLPIMDEPMAGAAANVAEKTESRHENNVPDDKTTGTDTNLVPGDDAPAIAYQSDADKVFGTETQVVVPDAGKISPSNGALSFWIKPDWQPDDQNDATFLQIGESGLQISKNVNYLRFEYLDKDGVERGLGLNISDWKAGEPHYIVGTYSGDARSYQLFVDGKLVSQNVFPSGPEFPDKTQLFIGSAPTNRNPALGEISGVEVGSEIPSMAEILRRFEEKQQPKPNPAE